MDRKDKKAVATIILAVAVFFSIDPILKILFFLNLPTGAFLVTVGTITFLLVILADYARDFWEEQRLFLTYCWENLIRKGDNR